MAKPAPAKRKRAPRSEPARDPLEGFRAQNEADGIDPFDPLNEEQLLPESFTQAEVDIADVALETKRALQHLDGPLRYVLDRAMVEARQAVRQLIKCSPNDGDKVRELQWQVSRFDKLVQWVFDILLEGRLLRQIKTQEQMDELYALLHTADQVKD